MFDIGMSEMVLLLIIGLIAIGPKQLPEVAAKVARTINDLKRLTADFTAELTRVRESTKQVMQDTQAEIQKAIEEPEKNDES
jgi:Tat protein translocase TatB subunit